MAQRGQMVVWTHLYLCPNLLVSCLMASWHNKHALFNISHFNMFKNCCLKEILTLTQVAVCTTKLISLSHFLISY